ncbi:MAG: phosphatase PAP2 family protein [Pseudolabrys sp.]|nr:phosphatase PAP2 family protein [Pseudolabrys sp.]
MNRTGLYIALAIAVVTGLVFGFYPELDLRISRYFHGIVDGAGNTFALRFSETLMLARDSGLKVSTILVAAAVIALVVKLVLPRHKMLMPGRAVLFLIATMALGPGLLVNVVLKETWNRPRPIDVRQLGGVETFVPWWDPRGDCGKNCSFVSGDVSGAFWTLAPAALAPPQWRAAAYGAALALGTAMSAFRVIAGGHFVSDAIFAGVFTFLIIWLAYALIYRWPRTRLSDEAVEQRIERAGRLCYKLNKRLFAIISEKP